MTWLPGILLYYIFYPRTRHSPDPSLIVDHTHVRRVFEYSGKKLNRLYENVKYGSWTALPRATVSEWVFTKHDITYISTVKPVFSGPLLSRYPVLTPSKLELSPWRVKSSDFSQGKIIQVLCRRERIRRTVVKVACLWKLIVEVSVVLRKTVGGSDWRFFSRLKMTAAKAVNNVSHFHQQSFSRPLTWTINFHKHATILPGSNHLL